MPPVPEYLIPSFIQQEKKELKGKIRVLLLKGKTEGKHEGKSQLGKREPKKNVRSPQVYEFAKIQRDVYKTIDIEAENPEDTHVDALKSLSSRKLWKQRHGYGKQKFTKKIRKMAVKKGEYKV